MTPRPAWKRSVLIVLMIVLFPVLILIHLKHAKKGH